MSQFSDTKAEHNEQCDRCKSIRVASLSTKCSDRLSVGIGDREQTDYAPTDMGIGGHWGGDYVRFAWCLDCGKIQGEFPRPPTKLEAIEP